MPPGWLCAGLVLALYVALWLTIYFGFRAWAAGRGVQLAGRTARMATHGLITVALLPIGFAAAWLCGWLRQP